METRDHVFSCLKDAVEVRAPLIFLVEEWEHCFVCHTFSFCENFGACFMWQTFPCCMHISFCGCGGSIHRELKQETTKMVKSSKQSSNSTVRRQSTPDWNRRLGWCYICILKDGTSDGGPHHGNDCYHDKAGAGDGEGGGSNATLICTPQTIQLMLWFILTSTGFS